jgi:hypothetical protein
MGQKIFSGVYLVRKWEKIIIFIRTYHHPQPPQNTVSFTVNGNPITLYRGKCFWETNLGSNKGTLNTKDCQPSIDDITARITSWTTGKVILRVT